MSIRTFIAAEISEQVRDNFAEFEVMLKKACRAAKLVLPHNIHLTLVFIGDIPEEMTAQIREIMDAVSSQYPPFACDAENTGFFGPARSPRVVWAGVRNDDGKLAAMSGALAEKLRTLGLAIDTRPYVPHFTFARLRSGDDPSFLLRLLETEKERKFGRLEINRLILMKSDLTPKGPIYTQLHASALAG